MNLHLPRLLVAELTIIATGVIVYFAGNVIVAFSSIALIVALAVLLTYALLPAVNFFAKYVPRGLAVLATYVLLFATTIGFFTLIGVPLAGQAEQLAREYPQYSEQAKEVGPALETELQRRNINFDVQQKAAEFTQNIEGAASTVATKTGTIVASIFGTLSTLFLVLFVSIYFLLSGSSIVESLTKLFPKRRQRLVTKLTKDYDRILGSFVRGQLLIALIIAVVVSVFIAAIGLPYSVLLGLIAGITSLVPVVGTILAVVGPVLVAAFTKPILIPVFIVFFIVLNEISDKVLYPRIVGRAVDLHPLLVFFGFLIGAQVAGLAGAVLATPLLALVRVTVTSLRNSAGLKV